MEESIIPEPTMNTFYRRKRERRLISKRLTLASMMDEPEGEERKSYRLTCASYCPETPATMEERSDQLERRLYRRFDDAEMLESDEAMTRLD